MTDWKEFLKPDWKKIILFLILIIATSVPSNIFIEGADIGKNHGFPFNFYGYGGGLALLMNIPGQQIQSYFDVSPLIANIIIWYLISCLIILVYNKYRSKK